MPVTAKLSREFYEKLGDKVVDELVALFNQVDATYRTELRELNELNFSRFDDKLERRLTEFRVHLERPLAEIDRRLSTVEHHLAELDPGWDRRMAESDARWKAQMADLRAELIKWMFLFWLGTVASMLGIGRALLD